jgi:hypothetical protein
MVDGLMGKGLRADSDEPKAAQARLAGDGEYRKSPRGGLRKE